MKYFLVQQRLKREENKLIAAFPLDNLYKIAQPSDVVVLVSVHWQRFPIEKQIERMMLRMQLFQRGDVLVLSGNPLLMATATLAANQMTNGDFTIFGYSKAEDDYISIELHDGQHGPIFHYSQVDEAPYAG